MCTSKALPRSLATNRVLFLLTQQHLMHKCRQECIPFLKGGSKPPVPQPVPATFLSYKSNTYVIELLPALAEEW